MLSLRHLPAPCHRAQRRLRGTACAPQCRYEGALAIWLFGAAAQILFALQLQFNRNIAGHERLKAKQFIITLIVVMVGSMLLSGAQARACLATGLQGVTLYGGKSLLIASICVHSSFLFFYVQARHDFPFGCLQASWFLMPPDGSHSCSCRALSYLLSPSYKPPSSLMLGRCLDRA